MDADNTVPLIDYQRTSLELSGVVLLVMVLTSIICLPLGAGYILPVALISGVLCLLVVLLSLFLTYVRSRKGLVPLIRGFMYCQFLRVFLGTIVLIALILGLGFDVRISFAWVLGWYWLLLATEVWRIQRSVSRCISVNSQEIGRAHV